MPQCLKKLTTAQSHSEAVDSKESMSQEALLTKDAAAEACEKYLTAEADYQAAQERLKQVFPFEDTDRPMSATQEAEKVLAETDHQAAIEGLGKMLVSLKQLNIVIPHSLGKSLTLQKFIQTHFWIRDDLQNYAPAALLSSVTINEPRGMQPFFFGGV